MPSLRIPRTSALALVALAMFAFVAAHCRAQAALLMEEPYGFFGQLNPTGHDAVYFARICAATPIKLRRCEPGEMGAVIARYSDIAGYDWIAIPLVPYLYSVENPASVPEYVDRNKVALLRNQYHERHLLTLGESVPKGGFLHGGWSELVGVAYERRIFAFSFATTEKQDDAFIARMNRSPNRSHFQLVFNNCADFLRGVLNFYFPGTFRRSIFPDAGITTPKQIAYKLQRYVRKHPATQLRVFEIPQILGYRHSSHGNKSISESLITTGYALPIVVLNPYLAGGLFVDYMVRGRYHLVPKHPELVLPANLAALTLVDLPAQNSLSASAQVHNATEGDSSALQPSAPVDSDLKEIMATHE